jgi:hypothetical protein
MVPAREELGNAVPGGRRSEESWCGSGRARAFRQEKSLIPVTQGVMLAGAAGRGVARQSELEQARRVQEI